MFSGNSGLQRTATELRLPAGGQVKMKGGEKQREIDAPRVRCGVLFWFFFLFLKCVCSTIAQKILLEEYKLLVFIAYSCFTALLE